MNPSVDLSSVMLQVTTGCGPSFFIDHHRQCLDAVGWASAAESDMEKKPVQQCPTVPSSPLRELPPAKPGQVG